MLTKEDSLQAIYQAYAVDPIFASLRSVGVNLVPGTGPASAKIMLVGQAPGKLENENGKPFSGRNGRNLASLFEDTGYHAEQTFRTTLVKYWPKSERREQKRDVTKAEFERSVFYLQEEIKVINPVYVALMGRNVINAFYPEITDVYSVMGGVLDGKFVPLHDPGYVMHRANKWPIVRSGFEKLARLAVNA